MKYSLYIHIPFCERKCFYCSFVVSVGQKERMNDYCASIILEMQKYKNKRIQSIYLGGGTPSLLNQSNLENLTAAIYKNFLVDEAAEFTMEANPRDLDKQKLQTIRKVGVNRLSIGAQTFHDRHLKYLGRIHDSKDIFDTLNLVRSASFSNVSLDLIFGLPGQTTEEIEDDLQSIIGLKPQHVSLYSLTIEKNSRFFVKDVELHDSQLQAEHYQLVVNAMNASGLKQYEVSNFAQSGYESKHNSNYWLDGEYIGLGIGAHSYVGGRRFWNISKLHDYIAKAKLGESVEEGSQMLAVNERMMDALLFGLRMNRGVNLADIERKYGQSFDTEVRRKLHEFHQGGWIILDDHHCRASDSGRAVLDELAARLI